MDADMGQRVGSSPFYDQHGMALYITASSSLAGAVSAVGTPGLPFAPPASDWQQPREQKQSAGGANGGASSFRSAKSCTSAFRRAFTLDGAQPACTASPKAHGGCAATTTFDNIPFAASPATDASHTRMAFAEPTAVFVDAATNDGGGDSGEVKTDVGAELDRDDSLAFAALSTAAAAARRRAASFGVAIAPPTMWLPGCAADTDCEHDGDDDDNTPPPPPPPLLREEIMREILHCRQRSGRTSHATTPARRGQPQLVGTSRAHSARHLRLHVHAPHDPVRPQSGCCAVAQLATDNDRAARARPTLHAPTILSAEALRRFDTQMASQDGGRPMASATAALSSYRFGRSSRSVSVASSSSSSSTSSLRSWCSSVFAPEADPLHPLSVVARQAKRDAERAEALGQATPLDE
jgi:hypothetical protein